MQKTAWFVVALTAIASGAIGFVVGSGFGKSGNGSEEIILAGSPGTSGKAADGQAAGSPTQPVGSGAGGAHREESAPGSDSGAGAIGRAIAELPPLDTPTGQGTITGTVRTEDGTPVAGVLVRATQSASKSPQNRSWKSDGGPPVDEDLETEVGRTIEWARQRRSGRREAHTGQDGSYVLTGLADVKHRMQAFKRGYEIESKSRTGLERPGAVVDFVASPMIEVPFDVILPGGGRPAEAAINVSVKRERSDGESWNTWSGGSWTPAESMLWLKPGQYSFVAEVGEGEVADQDGLRSAPVQASLKQGETCPVIVLQLKGAVGIRGKVTFPPDWRVDRTQIKYAKLAPGQTPDPRKLAQADKSSYVQAEEGGRFSIKDLAPGTYLVGAGIGWRRILAAAVVEVSDRMAEAELIVPAYDPAERMVVRCLGPDGSPVDGVEFQVRVYSGNGSSSSGAEVVRRSDGAYVVFYRQDDSGGSSREKEEGARHSLTATSRKLGTKSIEFTPGAQAELEIRFIEPALLEVTIQGYASSGLEGKLGLELRPAGKASTDGSQRPLSDRTSSPDAEGRQTLPPVEPGPYELVLMASKGGSNSRWEAWQVQSTQVLLQAGANKASVSVPPLFTLTVVVDKADSGGQIQLGPRSPGQTREGPWSRREQIGKEKKVVFELVAAGEYTIRVWDRKVRGQMDVTVSGHSLVNFEPQVINALRVRITDPQGSIAKTGFLDGDLVIAIDGKEFKNEMELQTAFAGALGKKEVAFTVLRAGGKVEVKVDTTLMTGSGENPGGDLEPATR